MKDNLVNAQKAYASKRYKDALKFYKEALTLDPKNALIMTEIADCLYNLLQIEDAIAMSESALGIDPNLLKPHIILSYLYEDLTKSGEHARISLELYPNSSEANCSYGTQMLREGKIQDAIQYLGKAVQIDSSMYLAHYNLSVCYQSIGDQNNFYKQEKALFRLKPNIKNLTGLLASYFAVSRPLLATFLVAPVLVVVSAKFKVFLLFHVFMIFLYISSGLISLRNKKWSYVKRNFMMVIILIIMDLFILFEY